MSKRTSPIWNIDKNKIQKILDSSSTFVSVLKQLGLNAYSGGNSKILKKRIQEDNLDLSSLNLNRKMGKNSAIPSKIPTKNILVENSSYSRKSLKDRLVKEDLIEYKCSICSNDGTWMGAKLTLQLDHINGKSNDNRLENLRFLCPNCHTQTPTFAGRNIPKEEKRCQFCGKETKYSSICIKCVGVRSRKLVISESDLRDLVVVQRKTLSSIAEMFGVADNTVKKRCIRLGIEYQPLRKKAVITKEQEKKILELSSLKKTYREIAEITGFTRNAIVYFFIKRKKNEKIPQILDKKNVSSKSSTS